MHADRKPYRRPLSRDDDALLDLRFIVRGKNHEGVCEARLPGAFDDGPEVVDKLGAGDVAVRIDHGNSKCKIQNANAMWCLHFAF